MKKRVGSLEGKTSYKKPAASGSGYGQGGVKPKAGLADAAEAAAAELAAKRELS